MIQEFQEKKTTLQAFEGRDYPGTFKRSAAEANLSESRKSRGGRISQKAQHAALSCTQPLMRAPLAINYWKFVFPGSDLRREYRLNAAAVNAKRGDRSARK